MEAFYQTVATFCFTLLGLWWGVVQTRRDEWLNDTQHRRMAYSVYLSFLIPGVMSLGSQLSGETRWVWQLVFLAASGFGVAATLFFMQHTHEVVKQGWFVRRMRWAVILLYGLMAAFAIYPQAVNLLGLDLKPLQLEGLLLTLLVFLGVNMAWEFMAETKAHSH